MAPHCGIWVDYTSRNHVSCLHIFSLRHVSFSDMLTIPRHIIPKCSVINNCRLHQCFSSARSVHSRPQSSASLIRTSRYKIYEAVPSPWYRCLERFLPYAFLRGKQDGSLDTMNVLPPSTVRGMKVLDKTAFKTTVQVPVLHIPSAKISELGKCLNKKMFKVVGIKPIAEIASDKSTKLLLLDPIKCPTVDSFTDEEKTLMQNLGVDLDDWQWHDIELLYENWTHSEVLRAILPKETDGITGFSSVGHILHLNLKDDVVDFKEVIGNDLWKTLTCIKSLHDL